MKFCLRSFNIYLLLALMVAVAGCESAHSKKEKEAKPKKTKDIAVLRFHFEANPDKTDRTGEIAVYRAHPVVLTVNRVAAIDESHIEKVELVEALGEFAIKVTLNSSGTTLLANNTSVNKNRHMAVFCQFGLKGEKLRDTRWLAAPYLDRAITDGVVIFTPDATREEAVRIVAGVNNAVKILDK